MEENQENKMDTGNVQHFLGYRNHYHVDEHLL